MTGLHRLARLGRVTLVVLCLACMTLVGCGGVSRGGSSNTSASAALTAAATPTVSTTRARTQTRKTATGTSTKPSPRVARKPRSTPRPALRARVNAALAEFAACLRQNGVNIPGPGAKRSRSRGPIDTASPGYKAAVTRCRSILTAALRAKSPGG